MNYNKINKMIQNDDGAAVLEALGYHAILMCGNWTITVIIDAIKALTNTLGLAF